MQTENQNQNQTDDNELACELDEQGNCKTHGRQNDITLNGMLDAAIRGVKVGAQPILVMHRDLAILQPLFQMTAAQRGVDWEQSPEAKLFAIFKSTLTSLSEAVLAIEALKVEIPVSPDAS